MKRYLIYLFFITIPFLANSQKTIQRKIVDDKNNPIIGAVVLIKNTHCSAISKEDGYFKLTLNDSCLVLADTVAIYFIGYESLQFSLDSFFLDTSSIKMKESSSELTDVVVIGYGTQSKQGIVSFPWPPPVCSTRTLLNKDFFKNASRLDRVNSILIDALNACGYAEKSYYYVPHGFALVTRIEQISEDGKPLPGNQRWSVEIKHKNLSWSSYIESLFFSTPGYFRIIVFIVTDQPFSSSKKEISRKDATDWLNKGLNTLPRDIEKIRFNENYNCTALVYEFKKPESENAFLITPSNITADEHLVQSKIIDNLKVK